MRFLRYTFARRLVPAQLGPDQQNQSVSDLSYGNKAIGFFWDNYLPLELVPMVLAALGLQVNKASHNIPYNLYKYRLIAGNILGAPR